MSRRASRVTIERAERSLRIVVGPRGGGDAWAQATFLVAFLTVSSVTFARIVREDAASPGRLLGGVLFTLVYGLAAAATGYPVLWQLFGREEISATPEETTVTSRVLGMGRRRTVPTRAITRVDWVDRPFRWLRGRRRVVFLEAAGRRLELESPRLSLVDANRLRTEMREQIQALQRPAGENGYRS